MLDISTEADIDEGQRGGRGLSDQLISSGLLMKDRREDGKTEALYS
jgi:hypothetical protein